MFCMASPGCEVGIKCDQKLRSQSADGGIVCYEQIAAPEVFWNFDENISPSMAFSYWLEKLPSIEDTVNK